ncbi:hypothetical protein [Bradyrhizobium jicamae]|uniref:hypothetical protein n=1 Tax=Bradyrhizobium jicamae TaxID=280332 RepID=UPI001BA77D2E|nr:hypothetical protein [Bradyrhizobium jicamae]MBR0938764.1 hypothetical protein [Bradyrhizobium jicamae]
MHWWFFAAAAIVLIVWVALVARRRRRDALYDADLNRRVNNRLESVVLVRRGDDSGFPELIEIPPEVAQQFLADMQAYHSEHDTLRRDEIAFRARQILLQHVPAGATLPLTDVEEIFERLKSEG